MTKESPKYLRLVEAKEGFKDLEGEVFFRWQKKIEEAHLPDVDVYVLDKSTYLLPRETGDIYDTYMKIKFRHWSEDTLAIMGRFVQVEKDYNLTPAFPTTHDQDDGQSYGMTMLDYFAIKCFTAVLQKSDLSVSDQAELAYVRAMALLEERKKYIHSVDEI